MMNREFNKARVEDIHQSIYILYGLQTLAMWALIVVCIYLADGKSLYWLPSIFSSILIACHTALAYHLHKTAQHMDRNAETQRAFLKKMRLQDILAFVSAIVCTIALVISGWLGFTFGENPLESTEYLNKDDKSDKQLADEERNKDNNGQMSGALLGVNFMTWMVSVLCWWADYKFRKYLRTKGNLLSPEEYEVQVVREGESGTNGLVTL